MTATPIVQFGTSRFLQAHADLFFSEGTPPRALTVVQSSGDPARAARLGALAAEGGFPVRIRGRQAGRVIDEDLIKRGHLARLESHKEGLKTLKSLKPHRVVQLAPYPIMRDPDEIVELLSQFPERLAARGVTADEIQVNPVELRKKIWDMEFEACKIVAEEAEVDFLVSDNHMIGEDGMRGIDSSLDPAHCTPEWGLEILRQLKGHIEQAAG